jgi:hypothetical protein
VKFFMSKGYRAKIRNFCEETVEILRKVGFIATVGSNARRYARPREVRP